MIREAIEKLVNKIDLSPADIKTVMGEITRKEATQAQVGAFLTLMRMKKTPYEAEASLRTRCSYPVKADAKRLGEKLLEKVDGALKTLSAVEDSREAYHKELVAENEKLRKERDALRALFAQDRSYDDKSILDHMDVAGVLLHNKCGEVGFALSNKFSGWIEKAQAVMSGKV
jgi:hypothetical protein